jgi:hypothetical protein
LVVRSQCGSIIREVCKRIPRKVMTSEMYVRKRQRSGYASLTKCLKNIYTHDYRDVGDKVLDSSFD